MSTGTAILSFLFAGMVSILNPHLLAPVVFAGCCLLCSIERWATKRALNSMEKSG